MAAVIAMSAEHWHEFRESFADDSPCVSHFLFRSFSVLIAHNGVTYESRLTTQAQRPGPRDATIANRGVMPGSLQRMVRRGVTFQQLI